MWVISFNLPERQIWNLIYHWNSSGSLADSYTLLAQNNNAKNVLINVIIHFSFVYSVEIVLASHDFGIPLGNVHMM